MPAAPCWGLEPSTLVIAGAHHRAGSELLTRIMGALCKRCFNLKRWKTDYAPGARCAIDVNVGINAHDDQFNSSSLIAAYSHGLRLISTGHWKLPLNELEAALRAAGVPWKMVHVVRQPIDLVLSAYYYHQVSSEPWALEVDPPWYKRMGLQPSLHPGLSFCSQLRSLHPSVGVVLQAQHSMRLLAEMTASAEACAARPMRCANVWLETLIDDLDSGLKQVLSAIRPSAIMHDQLLAVMSRAGNMSSAQKAKSAHVTRGKHSANERKTLLEILKASPYGNVQHCAPR